MFILFILFFNFCFSASSNVIAHAYFFDVGQGHCFFLGTQDKSVAVLVDAGSSKKPKNPINMVEKANCFGSVKDKIGEYVDKDTKILIIVTHGDKDHCNNIDVCLSAFEEKKAKYKIFCGGKEADYHDFQFVKDKGDSITYGGSKDDLIQKIGEYLGSSARVSVEILSARENTKDKNDASLVTRVVCSGKSFLILGDAGGDVTDLFQSCHSDVLLASHHGASTENTNNQRLFHQVDPSYIIFSHGDVVDFFHPHSTAIQFALEAQTLRQTNHHVLFYGFRTDEDSLKSDQKIQENTHCHTFAQLYSKYRDLGYRLLVTDKAVFSTYTQGTITFDIHSDSAVTYSYDKGPGVSVDPITTFYLKGTKLAKDITDLYFMERETKDFLTWKSTQAGFPKLTSVYFQDRSLDKTQMVQFVRDNPQITKLTLMDTVAYDELKREWNNRGLVFKENI